MAVLLIAGNRSTVGTVSGMVPLTGRDIFSINGTLIWYYYICKREVWLMARQVNPDEHDENLEWGRFLHEWRYTREKKEMTVQNVKLDMAGERDGKLVVAEVKKSSKYKKSAAMQLLFYLWQLREAGVEAVGELRFPEEKRRETLQLDESSEQELKAAVEEIRKIVASTVPPKAGKIGYCKNCAYREFCWA